MSQRWFFLFCIIVPIASWAQNPFPFLIVDKAKFELHLASYSDEQVELKKKFHITIGKAIGDKEVEKDLKTPEGVYYFTALLRRPQIKRKFGKMALMMNYPNPMDQISGKTGYDIMLHATDEPARLLLDRDSEGCIVIADDQIEELSKSVRLGLTPIVVYSELKPEFLAPKANNELHNSFTKWLNAWENKSIDEYIQSYTSKFRYNGMNLNQYKAYKANLNSKYNKIQVQPTNIRFFHHPKYEVVSFSQNYVSHLKNGRVGFKSKGTKVLYFVKDSDGYRIAEETFSNLNEE